MRLPQKERKENKNRRRKKKGTATHTMKKKRTSSSSLPLPPNRLSRIVRGGISSIRLTSFSRDLSDGSCRLFHLTADRPLSRLHVRIVWSLLRNTPPPAPTPVTTSAVGIIETVFSFWKSKQCYLDLELIVVFGFWDEFCNIMYFYLIMVLLLFDNIYKTAMFVLIIIC